MSGIAVVFNRDGAPVEPESLDKILARLNHLGPEGSATRYAGGAAFGYQHFSTTPEELGSRQPLCDESGRYTVVFDGRLDNRSQLIAWLRIEPALGQTLPDAALFLQAYLRWGEDVFGRLLGPLAAVVYDSTRRRIICGRDPLSDRGLYYYLDSHVLVVASEPYAVLAHPAVSAALNETALALYLALRSPKDGATFFSAVRAVLPAHILIVEPESVRTLKYWEPPEKQITYSSDEEYAEHFFSLLVESVRCRLRTIETPGITLSGGLDSTSVAAVAARELANQSRGRLYSFSRVFDELHVCDERPYIEQFVNHCPVKATYVPSDQDWPLSHDARMPHNPSMPDGNPFRALRERLFQHAQAAGVKVLLTGENGDGLYAGADEWFADLLFDGRIGEAHQEFLRHVRLYGLRPTLHALNVRRLGSRLLDQIPGGRRLHPVRTAPLPRWLTGYARSLLRELDREIVPARGKRMHHRDLVLGLSSFWTAPAERYFVSSRQLELRHPYWDRRLIEYALAIPAYQLYNRGQPKYILRNTMKGLLPDLILHQSRHGRLGPLFLQGLLDRGWQRAQQYLQSPDAQWPRFVSAEWLNSLLPEKLRSESAQRERVLAWRCIALERWRLYGRL